MENTNCPGRKNRLKKTGTITSVQVFVFAGMITLICSGCGGGSGGNGGIDSSVGAATLVEGIFVDSPVEGLDYMTETHTGTTDEDGRFTCFEGEMISFMIGDVMLGRTMADEVITPMDFLDESEMPFDVTHPMITNMGRFLQSLDADGDPENGITISPEVREEMIGRMIDFNQSIENFENDPDVGACFDVFNGLNMPHNGRMWDSLSADEARQHMIAHMGRYMEFVSSEESPGGDLEHPMAGYTADQMEAIMDEHMGFSSPDDSDADVDHPMEEYMDEEMIEYMNEHMGFDSPDGTDGDFEHPMEEFMDEEMIEYMNEHMGFDSPDGTDGDFDHPMEEFMDDEMAGYMESHMGGNMESRM